MSAHRSVRVAAHRRGFGSVGMDGAFHALTSLPRHSGKLRNAVPSWSGERGLFDPSLAVESKQTAHGSASICLSKPPPRFKQLSPGGKS